MNLMGLYNRSLNYFSRHVMLNSFTHFIAGFGLALIIGYYFQGNQFFASPISGWLLLGASAIIHIMSFMAKP